MKKIILPTVIIIIVIAGYFGIKYFAKQNNGSALNPIIKYEEKSYEDLFTKPSREASEGCEWEEKEFEEIGVKFLAEKCTDINHNFIVRENLLYLTNNGDEITEDSIKVFEVFEKEQETDITQAINNKFFPNLTQGQAEICEVKDETKLELEFPKENYSISPSEEYLQDELDQMEKDKNYQPCGYYGEQLNNLSYFEYHPTEYENKYIFIFLENSQKTVDEQSIVFTNSNTGNKNPDTDEED